MCHFYTDLLFKTNQLKTNINIKNKSIKLIDFEYMARSKAFWELVNRDSL